MSEWREVRLGDHIETNLQSINKNYPFDRILYLDTGSITANKIEKLQEFNLQEAPSRAKRLVQDEDIIYSSVRPNQLHYGFVNNPITNLVVSTGFVVISCNKETIQPKYLFYYLSSDTSTEYLHSIAEASTSAYPSLKPSDIEALDVEIPPLLEQKAIAEVLSSLDDKIDLLHRQNKTLEQMAETLFRQWFVEEAQEDWEEVTFDDVLTISSSKRIFYKEYVDFGIPFYRSKEIIELSKGGTTSTELFISEERFNEIDSEFSSPKEGDILLTSVGTLGISYQVRKADKFYFKDGNLTWFKDFKLLPSSIIYCWLNSSIGKEELDNISIGSTQAALTISGLKSIKLKIPPSEIIEKINDELNIVYEKKFFNQIQIRTIESLRDTLLPKLMNGEVRIASHG